MERFTHLGRTFDFRLLSNRIAVLVPLGFAVGAFAVGGFDGRPGYGTPIAVGLSSFLAWALGRELDPDHPLTANVSVVAAGVVAFFLPDAHPGALYLIMVTARIVVRTTGRPPLWTDLAVNAAAAGWLAQRPAGWVAGMALAFGVARDAALPEPAQRNHLWWALAIGAVVSVMAGVTEAVGDWVAPSVTTGGVLAVGILGSVFVVAPDQPVSVADLTLTPLDPHRLQYARIVAIVTAALAAAVAGGFGIRALAPAWVTFAVIGADRLRRRGAPAT